MRVRAITSTSLALALCLVAAATPASALATKRPALKPYQSTFFARPGAVIRDRVLPFTGHRSIRARSAASGFGGPITVTVGGKQSTVTIYTSNAFTRDISVNQSWATFFATIPHGSELSSLTVMIESIDQITADCGSTADSCYDPNSNTMNLVGVTPLDGSDMEQIAAHEYGHHIATNRLNPPWDPVTWGPKYWASAQRVCSHSTGLARKMYPGDEGSHYEDNPAEIWAETYRVIASRQAGLTDEGWLILNDAWNPKLPGHQTDLLLGAGLRDVTSPWTTARTGGISGSFARTGQQSTTVRIPLSLDGTVSASASTSGGLRVQVKLLKSTGATAATGISSTTSKATYRACSQPFVTARIARISGTGRWALLTSNPGA
jgi:hypothetical protein